MRRSRRLRGLAPEEQAIDQVCFICHLRIHGNHLSRCVSTPCCSVFMHRSCYDSMVERLSTCGNCRSPNVGHVPGGDILETDEELDVDGDEVESEGIAGLRNRINEYRRSPDIWIPITRGRSFGTRYLTESTFPLGLSITCCIGTLLKYFPTSPAMSMV